MNNLKDLLDLVVQWLSAYDALTMANERQVPPSQRMHRIVGVLASVTLIFCAFAAEVAVANTPDGIGVALLLSGVFLLVVPFVLRKQRLSSAVARISLLVLATVLPLAAVEIIVRMVGLNLTRLKYGDVPIYFRPATVHIGNGVFRRPGPATWQGKPMAAFSKYCWGNPGPYTNESTVSIEYDASGFRNLPDLTDWDVVVTGDSFVELGFIPYEDLFTTVAARKAHLRVKNLGLAGTGTIFQTHYLKQYGKAPSARDAILCFFEGNDLIDFDLEMHKTNIVSRRTPMVLVETNNSLLAAFIERLTRTQTLPQTKGFLLTGAQELPMTVRDELPPRWSDLTFRQKELLTAGIKSWAQAARELGMRPWVMCIPDSRRVFDGYIRFVDTNSPSARWRPGPFAPHLETLCTRYEIRFVDAFPALRREIEQGRITYNIFGDAHLNAHGSRVLGTVLAEELKNHDRPPVTQHAGFHSETARSTNAQSRVTKFR